MSAKHDRKQFVAALDAGTLSCLPGKDGLADTLPARNAVNRTAYRGSSQLLLKIFQKQHGFPTAEYCTFDQVQKATAFSGRRSYLKKGSKGITLNFQINGEQYRPAARPAKGPTVTCSFPQNPKPIWGSTWPPCPLSGLSGLPPNMRRNSPKRPKISFSSAMKRGISTPLT
ncbi:MAG: ArdC family protein [Treponema sp.]|nr:ArdC family protein [Treponema sp.]